MASFTDVLSNVLARSSDVQQIIDALKGTIGKGIPLAPTSVNDAIAYAFSAKNLDATNSRAGIFYKADGSVLLQIDKNGVQASPDGSAAAAPVLTAAATQTLTNKTLTNPVVGGAGGTAAGTLGFNGTSLLVGDGVVNETIGPLGAWTAFTPTLTQGVALTLSTATGRYTQIGKTVIASVDVTPSSTGTAGAAMVLGGLPVSSAQRGAGGVSGWYGDFSGANVVYNLGGFWQTATTMQFLSGAAAGSGAAFGVTPAVTAASGDIVRITLMYEAP